MEPHCSPNSKDRIAATLGKGGLCVCRERKIERGYGRAARNKKNRKKTPKEAEGV